MKDALPSGWAEANFGAITLNHDGERIPVKATDRAAHRGKFRYFGAQGVIDYVDDYIFDGTYLLIAEDGANLTSRVQPIAQIAEGKFWVNNHAHVVESVDGISLKYLKHFMNENPLNGAIRGTAQPKLTQADLNKLRVPIPPTAEQDRIVAAIEEQFSRLGAGVSALGRARLNLARMRTAELVKAFEYLETTFAPTSGRKLFSFVTSGSRGWAKYYSSEGPTFLRIGNVPRSGIDLDLEEAQRVNPPATAEGRRTRVQARDLLISITADLGRVAVIPEAMSEAYINQHIALARPIEGISSRYLAWYLASPFGLRQWDKLRRGATKIGLGLDDIRALEIPIPAPDVQESTVNAIETAWDRAQRLERSLIDSESRAQNLRASLLVSAFSGRLADQTPSDEPASVLIKRIAAERQSSNGNRRRRGRKPRMLQEEVTA
jgi:type I restriction enzyme S subunit